MGGEATFHSWAIMLFVKAVLFIKAVYVIRVILLARFM